MVLKVWIVSLGHTTNTVGPPNVANQGISKFDDPFTLTKQKKPHIVFAEHRLRRTVNTQFGEFVIYIAKLLPEIEIK